MTDLLQLALALLALLCAHHGRFTGAAAALLAHAYAGALSPPPRSPILPDLVVTSPFRQYRTGDLITDQDQAAAILASELRKHVTPVGYAPVPDTAAPPPPPPPPAPPAATVEERLSAVERQLDYIASTALLR